MGNPLTELHKYGQSVWLDYIRRQALQSGDVKTLIENDGLRGMTANPTIFQQAIAAGHDYDETIERLLRERAEPVTIYETIAIEDIQAACDLFRSVYDANDGTDGFVSLEVAPSLAYDTDGTIAEARRLWKTVNRPNLMIKVPGTAECVPAVRRLLADGINVNVTLLFARSAYAAVAEAFLEALEDRHARGLPVAGVASVASFFVSRIDTLVDRRLEERMAAANTAEARARAAALRGRIAIANAKLAYEHFRGIEASARWKRLAAAGARPQRLLWASTSTKNPAFRDTIYVEELIGPETVNTAPPETIEAFRDHGVAAETLTAGVEEARAALRELEVLGLSLDQATDELLDEGIAKFVEPFGKLLATVDARARELAGRGA